jgi:site-specific DNA recombinase
MDRVAIYLRKSRADEEAEKYGEGETLKRHKQMLLKFAKEKNINIIKIREEIVSGESLVHRPEMLELLKEVEQGLYDGVLCMDMERLGRGNMQEQGLILETFKESKTKIITPRKTYNLDDEFDEEYSEFEAFMARKELKMINRRLQRGRIKSVEEGNYLAPAPPFGYVITYKGKSRTLAPHPEQAPIVKMIFDLYVNNKMGGGKISNKLNELGYKTYTGKNWDSSLVLNIIRNEVYNGKIQWGKKEYKPSNNLSGVEVKKLPREEWISVKGKHEPLVSNETFNKAQEILNRRSHVPYKTGITNPLAGLIICEKCGASMVYRPYGENVDPHIVCYNTNCDNKSSKFKFIEERLLEGLKNWLEQYEAEWNRFESSESSSEDNNIIKIHKLALSRLKNELKELETQKNNLHDLLERGIYDVDTYLERSQSVVERIESTKLSIINTSESLKLEEKNIDAQNNIIPTVKKVLDLYSKTHNAEQKNNLLKTVLDKAVYNKEKKQRNGEFTLVLYPKLKK